ncbi:MAG: ABC transporter ATP-binding protein [Acholeplasmatales bacterium]
MAKQIKITKIKANIYLSNVKRLQDRIFKTSNYPLVLKENITRVNEQKINNLINEHDVKISKIKVAINPEETFKKIEELELKTLEDNLYWNLREKENTLNKKMSSNEQEKSLYEQEHKKALEELFSKYDNDILACKEKHNEDYLKEWYFKKYKVSSLALDLEAHKKHYEALLKELLITKDEEVKKLKIKLEEKLHNKLSLENQKTEKKLVRLNQKLDKALAVLNEYRKIEYNNLLSKLDADKTNKQLNELVELYKEDNNTHLLIQELCMYFGGLKAVEKLSVSVKKGEVFGLIGPNGAGKTTVFNCITQFYNPTSGEIYFKNKENSVLNLNNFKVHDVIKHGIVRTFQNVELILELTVLENLLVGSHTAYKTSFFAHALHLRSLKKEEEINTAKALNILEKLDLLQYKDFYPIGLPYGILKRIELARTLMLDPELVILDEPAAGLNEQESLELAQLILKIKEDLNLTIFLVEHDMSFVMGVCDRICVLNFGRKIALGTPKEIQNNPLVQEAYLGSDKDE